jgi:hypothetical protein
MHHPSPQASPQTGVQDRPQASRNTSGPRLWAALLPTALACGLMAWLPAHAVTYTELGDAGQTPGTAQTTGAAAGALTDIFGSLASTTDADLYVINITSTSSFSASTVNLATGSLDTQLFLFTLNGTPLFANDDEPGGASFLSRLPAGTASSLTPGLYLLGIANSGTDPVNAVSQLVFAAGGLSTDVRGPAANLQPPQMSGFSGTGFTSGAYTVQLTGVAAIPEPATTALWALGGAALALAARRRRAAAQIA